MKLDRALTYRHHLETLRKKLSACVLLLRRLAGSGWGAGAMTLRTAALSLSTRLLSTVHQLGVAAGILASLTAFIIDALRIVTGCLRPTLTDNLSVLSGQPAELRRQGATLSLANRSCLDHTLHGQLTEPQAASKERLKSRHSFVSAVQKLLCNLSELGIRAAQ